MSDENKCLQGSLDKYLKELSGRTIVPGGGSAAALAAALGAGLNLMVINYSVKEGEGGEVPGSIAAAKKRQEESLEKLSSLIDEDCKVFSSLMEVASSGKDAQEEYKAAATVPMNVCGECHVSMEVTRQLLEIGNKNLVTDIGSAAEILKAAFNSARLNVEVNLRQIKDRIFLSSAKKTLSAMERDIDHQSRKISHRVRGIMRKKGKE